MRYRIGTWLGWILLLAALPAAAQTPYILHAPSAAVPGIASRNGLTVVRPLDAHDHGIFLVTAPSSTPSDQLVQQVTTNEAAVVGFELDKNLVVPEIPAGLQLNQSTAAVLDAISNRTVVTFYGASTLSGYVNQPAAGLIRVSDAQTIATGAGVVAVIDTGVDPNHPVLAGSLVAGYDFIRELAGPASELADLTQSTAAVLDQSTAAVLDKNQVAVVNQSTAAVLDQSTAAVLDTSKLPPAFGHGTMVAGLIHLVAPTAKIMPLKAFKGDGTSDAFSIIRAIYFAAENGAKVINMSFSLNGSSEELMRAISFADSQRVISVASAGNSGREVLVYPAAYRNVVSVASTNNSDIRSSFSNYGNGLVYVAAPGEGVITIYPGKNYAGAWGTSFSTPLVAGGVALIAQLDPTMSADGAFGPLSRGKKIGQDLGSGRVDLYQAVISRAKQ